MSNCRQWQRVCCRDDLAEGQFVEFTLEQSPRQPGDMPPTGFVFLRGGKIHAYLNYCPHLGIELNWMPGRFMDAERCFIQCSTHGALFTPDTGRCIAGPCQGDSLTPLALHETNGEVLVRLQD